jgi:hypothetical protein
LDVSKGIQLLQKFQDYIDRADQSHGRADAASNYLHRQECLAIEEMWRDKAKARWQWLTQDNLPVAL